MTASNPRKTEADALYRKKKYGEAATAYSAALKLEPTNEKIYSNRAACFQQMREPTLALADVKHVLTYDPANAKALARKQVYEQQLKGMS